MYVLGIESTAHTFGASVLEDNNILSNIIKSVSTEQGGMIPWEVGAHHTQICDEVVKEALEKAAIQLKDIQLVAYSNAPGLGHALRVGVRVAKTIALKFDIPIIGVNHCIAHLEIGRFLTNAKDPILLYASGANTQIIAYESGRYRIFGETLDTGIGNFLDTFARDIGLGFPGGPKIEKLALEGKRYIKLPYSVKGMDLSFSGILSNLKKLHKENKDVQNIKEDLAYSAQETAFAMMMEVAERAMAHTGKKELLLGGGVACNKRLQEMAFLMCKERGANLYSLENQYFIDNSAMIAVTGKLMFDAGVSSEFSEATIKPYERTDEVDVVWRS
jgi:N6-L-threonylcarbamoyladenine synthase